MKDRFHSLKKTLSILAGILASIILFYFILLPGLRVDFDPSSIRPDEFQGRVRVEYWDMWTGFEGAAMQRLVDQFNASQDRIWVEKITISQLNERFLVSVAGNNAPDVASIFTVNIPSFAEKGALLPLDELAREHHIKEEDYLPVFWKICQYRNRLYALPTTASSLALHYNKKIFREAGIDLPPATINELDQMADRLTVFNEQGRLERAGFLPTQPGWWHPMWAIWFGGNIWDGHDTLTIDSDASVRAFEWARGYSEKYGADTLQNFKSGFGNAASPQEPFLSGVVAMELQGVWMNNFVEKYNPDLEYGVAPFPSAIPGQKNVALVETNILVIPASARHPREAFEFLAFVSRQENLEQLCLDQHKITPHKEVSERFWQEHKNPYIETFYELAQSPNAVAYPNLPIWAEMSDEIFAAFTEVWLGRKSAREALGAVQEKMQRRWEKELAMIKKREQAE